MIQIDARDLRRVEVEDGEDDEGGDDRDDDTADRSPHVLRRDVAPPAVVEAEGNEDRKHDPEHECDDIPFEIAVVVPRPGSVEAHVPGELPRQDDQGGIGDDLPEPVSVDRRAHLQAGTPTAERTASTTRSCTSSPMPPHIGSARFSAAIRSVSGSAPRS